MRTFALVSMGSAIFTIMSVHSLNESIAGQIVTGVGFIGAGVIIFDHTRLRGITTAAGLWVSAAVGMTVGFQMYGMAVFASVLALLTFIFFWSLESASDKLLTYNKDGSKRRHPHQE